MQQRPKKPTTTCFKIWMTLQTSPASLQQLQNLPKTLPAALSNGDPSSAVMPKQGKAGGAQMTRTSKGSNQRTGETHTMEPGMSFPPCHHSAASAPSHTRSLPGPMSSDLEVFGLFPTRHHNTTQVSWGWQSPGTASHVPGLSRCCCSDSQRVINPSCTPKSEMAHSLHRRSARDDLISLSEALPLSSCWDWIYERSALHPRQ